MAARSWSMARWLCASVPVGVGTHVGHVPDVQPHAGALLLQAGEVADHVHQNLCHRRKVHRGRTTVALVDGESSASLQFVPALSHALYCSKCLAALTMS